MEQRRDSTREILLRNDFSQYGLRGQRETYHSRRDQGFPRQDCGERRSSRWSLILLSRATILWLKFLQRACDLYFYALLDFYVSAFWKFSRDKLYPTLCRVNLDAYHFSTTWKVEEMLNHRVECRFVVGSFVEQIGW